MKQEMPRALKTAAAVVGAICFIAGCGKNTDQTGNRSKSIAIGAILPLTGPAASYGEAGQRGILLAKELFLENHPELLEEVDIRFEDDKASPKDGLAAFQKLQSDHIPIIVGPMVSGVALAIASGLDKNDQVLLVMPTATNPKLRGISPNIFRTCVSDDAEGTAMAEYVTSSWPHDAIGVLHINNEYGLGMATAFKDKLESKGGKVVEIEAYDASAMDFRNVILKVLQGTPSAIFLVGQKEQAQVISQLRALGFSRQILGTTMFEDPAIFSLAAANGAIFSSRVLNNGELDGSPHPFFKRFNDRYGNDANYYAAACFDSATVALESARLHSVENQSLTIVPRNIGIERGATGSLIFDSSNDVQQSFVIKKIEDGKAVVQEK